MAFPRTSSQIARTTLPKVQHVLNASVPLFNNYVEVELFGLFILIIIGFLIFDLGGSNSKPVRVSAKAALIQSIFWVVISLLFGLMIFIFFEPEGDVTPLDATVEYFACYLTEKALSIDNIFVIILILNYFGVASRHYHRILFWGVLGAVVFRAIFIFVGTLLIAEFHWILYLFGFFLVYSGIKIFFQKESQSVDPGKNPVARIFRKYFRVTDVDTDGSFMVRINNKIYFTTLALVMVLIESTDIVFAVDSIPAAFAITKDEFLIYTSNIFAVMGLRAMFFLLSDILNKFYLLEKGVSFILFFIGIKMLLVYFDIKIPPLISLSVIIFTLAGSIIFSNIFPLPREEDK